VSVNVTARQNYVVLAVNRTQFERRIVYTMVPYNYQLVEGVT